jgi:hypothetical protein
MTKGSKSLSLCSGYGDHLVGAEIERVGVPGLQLGERRGTRRVPGLERLLGDPARRTRLELQAHQRVGSVIRRLGQEGLHLPVFGESRDALDLPETQVLNTALCRSSG